MTTHTVWFFQTFSNFLQTGNFNQSALWSHEHRCVKSQMSQKLHSRSNNPQKISWRFPLVHSFFLWLIFQSHHIYFIGLACFKGCFYMGIEGSHGLNVWQSQGLCSAFGRSGYLPLQFGGVLLNSTCIQNKDRQRCFAHAGKLMEGEAIAYKFWTIQVDSWQWLVPWTKSI